MAQGEGVGIAEFRHKRRHPVEQALVGGGVVIPPLQKRLHLLLVGIDADRRVGCGATSVSTLRSKARRAPGAWRRWPRC
jgi:hypothetical protein